MKSLSKETKIAIVGKYVELHDAYLSVVESLCHAGYAADTDVKIKWVNAEELTEEGAYDTLGDVQGILVPGGFGDRGIEGKIAAAKFAREQNIPYFGICLGMQVAVIEYARSAAGLESANSSEIDPETPHPVIDLLPEQKKVEDLGGTMRLGAYPCRVVPNTLAMESYAQEVVEERHRHRYEFNNDYREQLEAAGLVISGTSPDGNLVEIIELKDHPWFMGVQFHPEFTSRPDRPQPLFKSFVEAATKRS